jgi:hypothetical protein
MGLGLAFAWNITSDVEIEREKEDRHKTKICKI